MNKFSFIQKLLENEKFNLTQKERFLKLVSKELDAAEIIDKKVLEDIRLIKEKIGLTDEDINIEDNNIGALLRSSFVKSQVKPDKTVLDIEEKPYLNPKHLHDFLYEYNQDPILKYTCHTIDSSEILQNILEECKIQEYNFQKHLKIIHRNFKKLSFTYRGKVLNNVIGLMSTYLGTYHFDKGWSNNIKIKWTSPELELWCNQNIGKVPNPLNAFQSDRFRFPTIELNSGHSISNFSDLVIYYKNLFHIKSVHPLKPLIEETIFFNFNDHEKYNIKFDEDFSNKIDLFTYTEALTQGFKKIIDMSKKYHSEGTLEVKLCFGYDVNNLKEFKIIILNSKIFGKNFTDYRPGDDITDLINNQINGLCDFYIKAHFEDKQSVGLVNVWNGKIIEFTPCEEEIEGVEFKLKMY